MITGVSDKYKAKVTKNNIQSSQANLDFSEKAITGTSQHSPINNGQVTLTNQDGSTANLDFSEKKITTGTTNISQIGSGDPNLKSNPFAVHADTPPFNQTGNPLNFGNNATVPVITGNATETVPSKFDNSSFDSINNSTVQYGGGMGFDNVPNNKGNEIPTFVPYTSAKTNNQFNSNKMTTEMYNKTIADQKADRVSNLSNMQGWEKLTEPSKPKLDSYDFFAGTKSGNETFTDSTLKMKDGTYSQIKGYADVDPSGDFSNLPEYSNAKKNSKALKDQFDLYSKL